MKRLFDHRCLLSATKVVDFDHVEGAQERAEKGELLFGTSILGWFGN